MQQQQQQLTAPFNNAQRVATVAKLLATHILPGYPSNAADFFKLCLSLARGIDYAVANNEIPTEAQDLPSLLKQVCQRRNDQVLAGAIMVLMISVKNACKLGWFSDKENQELFTLANEVGSNFCSPGDISIGPRYPISSISTIMARFYPLMKMGQILVSLEVKPGYGAYMSDFHISKNTTHSPQEKVRLFVAQTDSVETSACIISPQQVSFLMNGKGVDRRTNVLMDTGPQMPTNITGILKYGTNLLQAVGQFNGHYIIIVAFMSMTSSPDTPMLQDYVQSDTVEPDSDSDIIEGPSRISLNCPISRTRINIPVKGHLCKHLQCFDFSNYIDINSRRPSWRCPHCNRNVCYTDIRVDQNIVKVLKEVGDSVADVIISVDGSWKAVLEGDDNTDQVHDKTLSCLRDGSGQQEPGSFSDDVAVLDLTEDDNEMDTIGISEIEDRKPILTDLQSQSADASLTMQSNLTNTSQIVQNVAAQTGHEFWHGNGPVTSAARSNVQVVGNTLDSSSNFMSSPLLPDVSSTLSLEAELRGHTSIMQSQFSTPSNVPLQQSQFMNQLVSQEHGRSPTAPRYVNRTPFAVQALPAQSLPQTSQQRSRTTFSTSIPSGSYFSSQAALSAAPTSNAPNVVSTDMERQHQFSRSHVHLPQVPDMASSSLQNRLVAQNSGHQDPSFISGQSTQQVVNLPAPSQVPNAYGVSSCPPTEHQNPDLQRLQQTRGQSPGILRSSSSLPRPQTPQGGLRVGIGRATGSGNNQQERFMVAPQQGVQMGRQSPTLPVQTQTSRTGPSYPINVDGIRSGEQRGNSGNMVQSVSRGDALLDVTIEQNWQPTGRMRGSLTPGAYCAAMDSMIIRPTQSAQAVRLPNQPTQVARRSTQPAQVTRPSMQSAQAARPQINLPSHLQMLLANSRYAQAQAQGQNNSMTEPTGMIGASGMQPGNLR